SIAAQLGRSPQAGATVVSTISLRAAALLVASGVAFLALSVALSDRGLYPVAVVMTLIGLSLTTPGLVGLVAIGLGRRQGNGSKAGLVARGAIEANPRRAALAAAIMALGIAAVIPPQLGERALIERIDLLTEGIRPGAQELRASDDAFASVPIRSRFARRALRNPGTLARPTAFTFIPFQGRKIELRAFVPSTRGGLLRHGIGVPQQLPKLRAHPEDVLISRVMASGLGIDPGDSIELDTPSGPRKLKILAEVEDFGWPSGTIYMDIGRYRSLYGTGVINALTVDRRSRVDGRSLQDLRPLHTVSGAEFAERIKDQMQQSTKGLVAMRVLTLLAALVAVGGIITTSVFARRREWAVLRAMGMRSGGLFAALALETLLVMVLGGLCGVIGGLVSFRGPGLGFLESQGYVIDHGIPFGSVGAIAALAVLIGTVAAALPAWLTARVPLASALSYE
ncbi:MAG: ABC transporter permease, partial [Solirubrobacterales bacterium]